MRGVHGFSGGKFAAKIAYFTRDMKGKLQSVFEDRSRFYGCRLWRYSKTRDKRSSLSPRHLEVDAGVIRVNPKASFLVRLAALHRLCQNVSTSRT